MESLFLILLLMGGWLLLQRVVLPRFGVAT